MATLKTKPLIRLLTCGSVDDGKSTLIGRLLVETDSIPHDTVATARSVRRGGSTIAAGEIDFSLLTDGLEAEREQGITIDVAYRSMSLLNGSRLIIADAPGHEQYTRNMVTGASQADVAILLVDATRLDTSKSNISLLAQTKRHAAIVKMLGLKHIAVAVNKIDLLNFDEEVFKKIKEEILSKDNTVKAFNVGTNAGKIAGQSIMHCHIHLIPRREGDVDNPQGGVRSVIPKKQYYKRKV